ncbi:AmmeMemoRadiSam system protein A [Cognatazoarcus halotolerans]|uniref:AmmeMemoRadiSam system protein A n=1 Tax=Cognatazoarcus halotolerans TaxID=2686016 RepID=UPI00135AC6B0|nr:AmmeMemoRadiSam system protein A [Cognatazoarcus halotolerans]
MPDTELGPVLLGHARAAIAEALGLPAEMPAPHPRLGERGATFVTLTQDGQLRGCIGSLNAHRGLGTDVRENAIAAATRDPRFTPLERDEFERTRIEVSLLSKPEFMEFTDEADALAKLEPGVDGVILFNGCQRATFLPQVWEQFANRVEFLEALKRKAGLPAGFWGPNIMLATYRVQKWKESTVPA